MVGSDRFSITCESIPYFDSRIESVKPTGPPPTITIGTCVGGAAEDDEYRLVVVGDIR